MRRFIETGKGDDTLNYGAMTDPVTIRLGGSDDRFQGTMFDDNIDGSAGNDSINGGGGDDNIRGGAGLDRVIGGDGNFVFWKGDLVKRADNGGYADHILDFAGGGGYNAYPGVEDDLVTFANFNGAVTFNQVSGFGTRTHIYEVYDNGVYEGDLLITFKSTSAADWVFGAGDLRQITV